MITRKGSLSSITILARTLERAGGAAGLERQQRRAQADMRAFRSIHSQLHSTAARERDPAQTRNHQIARAFTPACALNFKFVGLVAATIENPTNIHDIRCDRESSVRRRHELRNAECRLTTRLEWRSQQATSVLLQNICGLTTCTQRRYVSITAKKKNQQDLVYSSNLGSLGVMHSDIR